jgi:stage II sporulation protein D
VRIFSPRDVRSIIVTPIEGEYDVIADTTVIRLDINNVMQVMVNGDYLTLKSLDGLHGNFSVIKFVGKAEKNILKIKPYLPDLKARIYDDNLVVSIKNKQVLIVNDVELENYVAGVVESEGGSKAHKEFFKTQAMLCRTWALANIDKHILDGYQLCDDVHCQVYWNKCMRNNEILDATKETEGLVIADTSMALITATFHSNCGGQTVNSEDIWGKPRCYLQSVQDSFCKGERSAVWEKPMSLINFINYLKSNGIKFNGDTFAKDSLIFCQNARKAFMTINGDSIHLKKMRADLKLKSTFFSIYKKGHEVIFKGRGYGHGVGLCQEGAMRMAKMGYNFQDIIKYYYKNTLIVSLKALNFFNASVSTSVPKDTLQAPLDKPVE